MTEEQLRRLERCVQALETMADKVKDHEVRIRTIEHRMWYFMGGVAVILTVGGVLIK